MASRRIVVIVNPKSQNGALGRRWSHIAWELRREMGSFEDALTRRPGDATRLAREAVGSGADCVVAIGGDGTVNEVANGFFTDGAPIPTDAALGFIPFGTGGDFRKTTQIPREIGRAGRIIKAGKRRRIDAGRLDYTTRNGEPALRMFVNIASFGISGLVDEYVNSSSKVLGGTVTFLVQTARAGLSYQNQRVRLVFDGDEAGGVEHTVQTVAVANGQYFGGGMHIAPRAELDDGMFDVVTIGDMNTADMVKHGWRLYRGAHLHLDKVHAHRCKTVRATPLGREPVLLDVDGETPGQLPATFTVVPGALSLMVP